VVVAAGAVVAGLVLGVLLPSVLPGSVATRLPGSCDEVRDRAREIRTELGRGGLDGDEALAAIDELQRRPDCFSEDQRREHRELREFWEEGAGSE
jgi:hypothetical protein